MATHHSYVYILASGQNGTLYVGVTNNLERRLSEHRQGISPGFAHRHHCTRLVYYEMFSHISDAIAREKQLKSGSRRQKVRLIESTNYTWEDLSRSWY